MMHFPHCFRFPPIFQKFSEAVENFLNLTFSRKNSRFSSAKISDELFLNFEFPPIFPVSIHFPRFAKINYYFPPSLTNFPPVLQKFTCFLHALCAFLSPPTLTMMHLCITQCMYWMPLVVVESKLPV